jgi:hypothetical protein
LSKENQKESKLEKSSSEVLEMQKNISLVDPALTWVQSHGVPQRNRQACHCLKNAGPWDRKPWNLRDDSSEEHSPSS